jgi:hypothetical protein
VMHFAGMRADTVLLLRAGSDADAAPTRRLPVSQIDRLDVSRDRHRRPWKGLGVGVLAGAVSGAVIGYSEGETDDLFFSSPGEKAAALGVLVGVVGGVVGLIAGISTFSDRWERVPLGGPRIDVSAAPRGRGLALRVTTAF